MIEAFPAPGGAGATGSGLTCIVDTPLQRAAGIADSVDRALADWVSWGGRTAVDSSWARLYLERSCHDVYDWLEGFGIEWDSLIRTEGNSVPRQHHPRGGGAAVMDALLGAARSPRVEWLLSTAVVGLSRRGDVVAGVLAKSDGKSWEIPARAVLLATGGFANSESMLARYGPALPEGGRLLRGGAEQALGLGHELLAEAGADFVGLDRVWAYAYGLVDPADPAEGRGLAFWLTNDVWVNLEGRRFHDESRRGGASATPALLQQPGATCWSIFDAAEVKQIEIPHPRYRSPDGSPNRAAIEGVLTGSRWIRSATTLAALADATGLPAAALTQTIEQMNHWAGAGDRVDPEFGRPLEIFRPVTVPPFYAAQFFPLARKCLGGVRTDLSGRVLRTDGSTIEGLYAGGELAGMAGGHVNGRAALEGTMFGPSLLSGRVAAGAIADVVTQELGIDRA